MEISLRDEIGMIFAATVGAKMSFAIWSCMIVASLTELGATRVLLAIWSSGMMVHPLRQSFLLGEGALKLILLLLRSGGSRGAIVAGVKRFGRTPVVPPSTFRWRLAAATLVLLRMIASATAGFSLATANVGARAGHMTVDNLLIMLSFHLGGDPIVQLA